jgi:hypothetical protein
MTAYVQRVLHLYRTLPQTCGRVGPADRRLAQDLERRAVPLQLVEAALCLAALRRLQRPPQAPSLPPIRSLHYILPILDELQDSPLEQAYLAYLRDRLQSLADTGS